MSGSDEHHGHDARGLDRAKARGFGFLALVLGACCASGVWVVVATRDDPEALGEALALLVLLVCGPAFLACAALSWRARRRLRAASDLPPRHRPAA